MAGPRDEGDHSDKYIHDDDDDDDDDVDDDDGEGDCEGDGYSDKHCDDDENFMMILDFGSSVPLHGGVDSDDEIHDDDDEDNENIMSLLLRTITWRCCWGRTRQL